ncbi:MAG: MFS transporter [Bacteroidetes bacterium]|nr:MFS transporter [Bacteroidota bacterium]
MLLTLYHRWLRSYRGISRAVWFLAAVNLVNRTGSMVIGFITIYLTQALHFDIRSAGYILGCFGVGAIGGAYLGGKLTDRIGYYQVQLWSLVLNGVMLLVLYFMLDFWMICGTVFLMSLVSEAFRPANSVAVLRNSTLETRTRSVSLMRMAFNIGWTISPVVGGFLVSFGWSWLFWIDGLTCIAAALALRWLLPPGVEVSAPETALAVHGEGGPMSPYRDRRFLFFWGLTFLGALVFMQIVWTVPVYFKQAHQWPEYLIGLVMAINGLLVFVVEMPLIYLIEKRRPMLWFVRLGLLMYILAYLSFNLPVSGILSALSYMLFISLGEIFVMPFSSNYMYRESEKGNQGAYSAFYGMSYSVANIIAPLLGTQMIAAWGFSSLWYTLSGLALLSLAGFRILEKWPLTPGNAAVYEEKEAEVLAAEV